jgi:hypothetical protein
MDYENIMNESRCSNSGALLFHPSASDKETLKIKADNKALTEKVERLEKLVLQMLEAK